MDMIDFFFPEQSQAAHLRTIASRSQLAAISKSVTDQRYDQVSDLRTDVKFLTLVLTAILKRLVETKTMSLADVQDLLDEVDSLDGLADGGLEPGVLRGLLGVLKQDHNAQIADPDQEAFQVIAEIHRRHRR